MISNNDINNDNNIFKLEIEMEFTFDNNLFILFLLNCKEYYNKYYHNFKILN